MKSNKAILLIFVCLSLFACKTSNIFLEANANQMLEKHIRVAILPFMIDFSEDYKSRISIEKRQVNWPEQQQREASLDLQKGAFIILTKRAAKKHWSFTVQDFLTTNKILQKEDIRFSELQAMEKGKLARLLGVDAVLWGETSMEFDTYIFENNMTTRMQLFDSSSSILIWQDEASQDQNNRDSLQDLATRSIKNLINALPYKSPNGVY